MNPRAHVWTRLAAAGLATVILRQVNAQWLTQSVDLQAGWNAIFLHVDASHATLQEIVGPGNPVQEVWLWKPASGTHQFVQNPQAPAGGSSRWASWLRSLAASSELQRLIGNSAYLVRVDEAVPTYTWALRGRPVPLRYDWTTSGLNFLGFPTPASAPPSFEDFLAQAPDLLQAAELYRYVGGELGPGNPARLFTYRTAPLVRGQGFWIRAGTVYNRYFGPFELDLQDARGVRFGDSLGQYRLRLRNRIAKPVTVTLIGLPSETPPAGQPAIAGPPPLLVRGDLSLATLTYTHSHLDAGPQSWLLKPQGQPGSEVEVVIGVDRAAMSGGAGTAYAAVLRFTDSLGLSQVDVPVSAEVASRAGLWVGQSTVNQVRHYLKRYERDAAGTPVQLPTGEYHVTAVNQELGATSRAFPLRFILHYNETEDRAVLLQRVYCGIRQQNSVVATRQSALDPRYLAQARRISAGHLPWTAGNAAWPCTGTLQPGGGLAARVTTDYADQASNPFLHTYHPDHDNLSPAFDEVLPQGEESYTITRDITFTFAPPADDFESLTTGGETLAGTYAETVTVLGKAGVTPAAGAESRHFDVRGTFSLSRASTVGTLTTE